MLPAVLADTTISVTQSDGLIYVSGTCVAPRVDVALQAGLGVTTVWVDQVAADENGDYSSSFVPPQEGSYTVFAACAGDSAASQTFCIGDGCPADEVPPQDTGTGSNRRSGGGGSIQPGYSQTQCNDRVDNDRDGLTDFPKDPQCESSRDNSEALCAESWICTEWSDCQGGLQYRSCDDVNVCETIFVKPIEQRSCGAADLGPRPGQVRGPYQPPVGPEEQSPFTNFWNNYKWWLLGILGLLLLAIIIVLILVHAKKKHVVYNYDELKEWIQKEQAMGTSKDDIKEILADETGWDEQEIEKAFSELNPASPAATPLA
ncbi:hypothetical protein COV20_02585 [Candidatus Woesearchaeota archaeon CG10_big_fil_rev_8_21_14_0_10_45_16]|nr:MAG: hypothetical protein COV20_02585 [Candidatus Woesearchaeota archaeon CG10_big_fil_rev_8_21_14_0_10_45_16]